MISPELLRRYLFFGVFDEDQLKAIAMIAEERAYQAGETILEEGKLAEALYLLMDGSVDLFFIASDEAGQDYRKELTVGEVNPGEPFGISALIEPYITKTTARASKFSQVIKIDAASLRSLCDQNQRLAYLLMQQILKAAMERLHAVRVQLAAAWA